MSKTRVELISSGIQSLLKSEEMQAICSQQATAIASRAGTGYKTDVHIGKTRCNASVWPEDEAAKRDNYKNNTLLKAVGR